MIGNKGQMATNLPFIMSAVVFFITLSFLSVSMASTNTGWLKGGGQHFTTPTCSAGVIILDGLLDCAYDFTTAFFGLMSVSSEFAIFNGIILTGLIISVAWALASLLRGGGG